MFKATVSKQKLNEILDSLRKEYRLAAPVNDGEVLVFKDIQDVSEIRLNDDITYKSPKEFVFPQVEQILVFGGEGDVKTSVDLQKTIILGIKPCDIQALKVLKAVFTKGKFSDVYFSHRLDNTILVGMGCISEKPGCFCSELGINREFSADCDLFLQDMGDSFSVAVLTDKGKDLLEKIGIEMQESEQKDNEKTNNENSINLDINADENILFSKINWEKISEKCLACGTCTYICPSCHCFEFRDVAKGGSTTRYRCWDSCMYPKFTLHASGHNPRASKKERYRQRIMHKYLYIKQNFGYIACTGCGRCIRSCPGGMNIKSVVKEIMEELK